MATEIIGEFDLDPAEQLDFTVFWGAADWVTATDYDELDIVYNDLDGKYYEAVFPHTSGATFAADLALSRWKELKNTKLWLKKYAGATPDEMITGTPTYLADGAAFPHASGLAIVGTPTTDGYSTTVFLTGGTVKTKVAVTVQVTTDNAPTPRKGERSIRITAVDR